MNSQTQPRKPKNDDAIAKGTISSLDVEKNPFALGFNGPPLTAYGRKVPLNRQDGDHMEMVKAREPLTR